MRAMAIVSVFLGAVVGCSDASPAASPASDASVDTASPTDGGGGDASTKGWTPVAAAGAKLSGQFHVTSVGDRLIAVGALASESTADTYEYKSSGWAKVATATRPTNLWEASIAGSSGFAGRPSALLLGGRTGATPTCMHEAWTYDVTTRDWKKIAAPPESGGKGFVNTWVALIAGGAIAIGGSRCDLDSPRRANAWRWDGSAWTQITTFTGCPDTIARVAMNGYIGGPLHAEAAAKDVLVVTGGFTYRWAESGCSSASAKAPEFSTNSWPAWMTHDGNRPYVFAGGQLSDWDGTSWNLLDTSAKCASMGGGAIGKDHLVMLCGDGSTVEWRR